MAYKDWLDFEWEKILLLKTLFMLCLVIEKVPGKENKIK